MYEENVNVFFPQCSHMGLNAFWLHTSACIVVAADIGSSRVARGLRAAVLSAVTCFRPAGASGGGGGTRTAPNITLFYRCWIIRCPGSCYYVPSSESTVLVAVFSLFVYSLQYSVFTSRLLIIVLCLC